MVDIVQSIKKMSSTWKLVYSNAFLHSNLNRMNKKILLNGSQGKITPVW